MVGHATHSPKAPSPRNSMFRALLLSPQLLCSQIRISRSACESRVGEVRNSGPHSLVAQTRFHGMAAGSCLTALFYLNAMLTLLSLPFG